MVKFGVENELVPAQVLMALQAALDAYRMYLRMKEPTQKDAVFLREALFTLGFQADRVAADVAAIAEEKEIITLIVGREARFDFEEYQRLSKEAESADKKLLAARDAAVAAGKARDEYARLNPHGRLDMKIIRDRLDALRERFAHVLEEDFTGEIPPLHPLPARASSWPNVGYQDLR